MWNESLAVSKEVPYAIRRRCRQPRHFAVLAGSSQPPACLLDLLHEHTSSLAVHKSLLPHHSPNQAEMLNRSLRRVVQNCPVTASIPPISQTPARLALRTHQRRHSSSKPPVPPNNGSQSISASVKTVGTAEKRPAATPRPSRRKTAKDKPEADEWTRHLPSVPSTQHLSEKGKTEHCTSLCISNNLQMFRWHPFSLHIGQYRSPHRCHLRYHRKNSTRFSSRDRREYGQSPPPRM